MYNYLSINGDRVSFSNLPQMEDLIELGAQEWVVELYTFINDWLSGQTYFDVPTSGSTGKPKIIRIHRADMIKSAGLTTQYLELRPEMNALLCLPARYIAGKMMIVRAIEYGLNLIAVKPTSNPLRQVSEDLDFAAFTPHQLNYILGDEETRAQLSHIRKVIIGGANLSQEVDLSSFRNEIFLTYGMTETLTHIAMRRLTGVESKWEDFTLISHEFKISTDEHDCLVIKTPYKHDILVKTNDIVEIVSAESFVWKGRIDNVINTGGIKIFPEEVEKKLKSILHRPFFLSSMKDAQLGEKVILIIEGERDDEDLKREILRNSGSMLTKYEQPKEIYFIPKFAYTETKKINRTATLTLI